jgi:hypothetical protein
MRVELAGRFALPPFCIPNWVLTHSGLPGTLHLQGNLQGRRLIFSSALALQSAWQVLLILQYRSTAALRSFGTSFDSNKGHPRDVRSPSVASRIVAADGEYAK